ncbi:hypothetical protein CSUI_006164 [Cystoisospora suis]|uniref:Uncharacterized protein n=1 Tax=Cystoisospora suis TaxID=483139 RepID=A0A2C6KUY3_9APIC|nr:hypothetical protein CSUI_006164 [Cystoisospora suis]
MESPGVAHTGSSGSGGLSVVFTEDRLRGSDRHTTAASSMLSLVSSASPTALSSSTADCTFTEGSLRVGDFPGEPPRRRRRVSFDPGDHGTTVCLVPARAPDCHRNPTEGAVPADKTTTASGKVTLAPDSRPAMETVLPQRGTEKLGKEVEKFAAQDCEKAGLIAATPLPASTASLPQASIFCLPPAALSSGPVREIPDVQHTQENGAVVSGANDSACGSALSPTRASSPGGLFEGLTVSTSSSLTDDSSTPSVPGLFSKPMQSALAAAAIGTDVSDMSLPGAVVDVPGGQGQERSREGEAHQEHFLSSSTTGGTEPGGYQSPGESVECSEQTASVLGVSHRWIPISAAEPPATADASSPVGLSLSSEETLLALSIPVSSSSHLCGSEPCVGPQPETAAQVSPSVPQPDERDTSLRGPPGGAADTGNVLCTSSGFQTAASSSGSDGDGRDAHSSGDVSVRRSSFDSDSTELASEGPLEAAGSESRSVGCGEATCSPSCGGPWGCFSCMRRVLASEVDIARTSSVHTKLLDVYERLCVVIGLTLRHQKTLQQLASSLTVVHRHQEQRRTSGGDSTLRQDAITLAYARQLLLQVQREYCHVVDLASVVSCDSTVIRQLWNRVSGRGGRGKRAKELSEAEAESGSRAQSNSARGNGRQRAVQRPVSGSSNMGAEGIAADSPVTPGRSRRKSGNNATDAALQEIRLALCRLSEAGQATIASAGMRGGPGSSLPPAGSSPFSRPDPSDPMRKSAEVGPEMAVLLQALRYEQTEEKRFLGATATEVPGPRRVVVDITGAGCPAKDVRPDSPRGSWDSVRGDSKPSLSGKRGPDTQANTSGRPCTRGRSSNAVASDESLERGSCEDGKGGVMSRRGSGELAAATTNQGQERSCAVWRRAAGGQRVDGNAEVIAKAGAAECWDVKGYRGTAGLALDGGEPRNPDLVERAASGARRANGRRSSDPGSALTLSTSVGAHGSATTASSTSVYCRGSNVRHQEDPYPHNVMIQLIQPLPTGIKLELKSNRSATSGAGASTCSQEEEQQQSAPREYALRVSLTRHETKYCSFHASHGILPAYNDAVRMRNKHAGLPFSLPLMTLEDLQARKELLDRGEALPNHGPDEAFMTVQERITYYKQLAAAEAAVARVAAVPQSSGCAAPLLTSEVAASGQQSSSSSGLRSLLHTSSQTTATPRLRSRCRNYREARAAARQPGSGANSSGSGFNGASHFSPGTNYGQSQASAGAKRCDVVGVETNSNRAG